jgi:hypothetical protein
MEELENNFNSYTQINKRMDRVLSVIICVGKIGYEETQFICDDGVSLDYLKGV